MKVIQSPRLAFVIFLACALAGMGLRAGEPALATGTFAMAASPGAAAPLATSGFGIQIVKATVQGPNGAGSNLPAGNPTGFATTPPCQNATVSGGGAQTNVTGVYT